MEESKGIRKLMTASLKEALLSMRVGEVCEAPDGYTIYTIRKECSVLNGEGYRFKSNVYGGVKTVTRLA